MDLCAVDDSPLDLAALKLDRGVLHENASVSLIDLGDRIGLIEVHTKANSLTDEVCASIHTACADGKTHFDALVIGNNGKHFSAGANLPKLLASAQDKNWAAIETMIRNLQTANMALKCGPLPVVAAPFSSALGGGCELCLHSARVVIAAETRMGLVEAGVGLIPAGGGTKEFALRAQTRVTPGLEGAQAPLQRAFERIVRATVSRSGEEAKKNLLTPLDVLVEGSTSPIRRAKQVARSLVFEGFHNPSARVDIPVSGAEGIAAFHATLEEIKSTGAITEYDEVVALRVATVLCGGEQTRGVVSEQYFLDLEREAFLYLLGNQKTQDRIAYMLKENKALRN